MVVVSPHRMERNQMIIEKESILTGVMHKMDLPVTLEQVAEWRTGTLIQDAMPHLNRQQREFLISGTTPDEWAEAFGDDGPEDEEPNPYSGTYSEE